MPFSRRDRGWLPMLRSGVLSAVIPGPAAALTRSKSVRTVTAVNTAATVVLSVAAVLTWRDPLRAASVAAHPGFLPTLTTVLVVIAVSRAAETAAVAWSRRPALSWWFPSERVAATIVLAATATVAAAPFSVAAQWTQSIHTATDRVFATSEPVTATPTPTRPAVTVPVEPVTVAAAGPFAEHERLNVVIIGGDAGAGRDGLRTDSVIVVSVDPGTGDTATISIPRNLQRVPFPAGTPMAARFPTGFPHIFNEVYGYAHTHPEVADGHSGDPGALIVKQAVAEITGLDIHYYILADMGGFVDLVDLIGGITIWVPEAVPTPGNPPDARHPVPEWIEPGWQHMDGTLTLAYARSRSADSDYERMGRQRCVVQAITAQATPTVVLTDLPAFMDTISRVITTDIPRERIPDVLGTINLFHHAVDLDDIRSLTLTPPVITPARWNLTHVRGLVADTIHPAGSAPSAPNDGPDDAAPAAVRDPEPSTATTVLGDACKPAGS